MIYPARVHEMERTWTENGWQTIEPPATRRGRDAMSGEGWEILDRPEKRLAASREPRRAGSPKSLGRSRCGMPINPRRPRMAALTLGG
jgi:hypothetical protein